ncbi:MAG: GTP 3',8-cyclase MoaA [Lachnospiraceae bacterium]|nr:GTP 3',8-cyclase MoaA [Lachnospiraceae bacterium]
MLDGYGREIDYLRISVTDKCNLRCIYCMPHDIDSVAMSEILTFEEITQIVSAAAALGIKKIKITGGEPLVRRDVCSLIKMIIETDGIEQVTLTTNGVLLFKYIDELKEAGIAGINVSIDTLFKERFKLLTGHDDIDEILKGIPAAVDAGIPLKLNTVSLDPGEPDRLKDASALIEYAGSLGIDIRFIELMPIGFGKDFPGIPHEVLIPLIADRYKGMVRDEAGHGNGPAVYYKIPGRKGSIGFISAMSNAFCDGCNRIRLTTKGYLKNCLCYDTGVDLRSTLRSGISCTERCEALKKAIQGAILCKPKSHCFAEKDNISEKDPMSRIGG